MKEEAAQHLTTTRKHDRGETPVVALLNKKLIWQLAHVFIYLFIALQFSEEARLIFLKTTIKIIDDGNFFS